MDFRQFDEDGGGDVIFARLIFGIAGLGHAEQLGELRLIHVHRLTEGLLLQYDFVEAALSRKHSPHNPSVTASPCHLPLHKGGFGAVHTS